MNPSHSIIIPVFNESKNELFPNILHSFSGLQNCEIIFVDGGSEDNTVEIIKNAGFKCHKLANSTRAARLNTGIKLSKGTIVLLHHPRSLLSREGLEAFLRLDETSWGGYTHRFNYKHPLLKFTSWYSNHVRFKRGIIYLDHCIFAPKAWLISIGMIPDVAIFEDTELCIRLRKFALPIRLKHPSTTSAIRFIHRGIWTQALYNQWLKIRYICGALRDHRRMNQRYEADLELNGTTKQQ